MLKYWFESSFRGQLRLARLLGGHRFYTAAEHGSIPWRGTHVRLVELADTTVLNTVAFWRPGSLPGADTHARRVSVDTENL
jgi:hypothetical protein